MGQAGINYFYTGVLGLSQDDLKLFYNFESGSENHLLSVPVGNPLYSGQILGDSGNFFQNSGAGHFTEKAIKVSNSTGIFSSNATFVVTQEKTGAGDGIIFSNFEGNNYKSGYYFGINDLNKFYFGYQDGQNPSIKTSLKNISDKNAWAVKLEENSVSFLYYNNNTLALEKESWSINSNTLLESDQWYIGSGKGLSNYEGYLDNFIYINKAIPDSSLTRLFSGLWNDVSFTDSSYLPYETGQVTGYQNVLSGITGVLNITHEFSGNSENTTSVPVYKISGLTGNISSGENELVFLQNLAQYCVNREETPIYLERVASSDTTGITGYEKVFSGNRNVTESFPVYSPVYETGFVRSGGVLTPLYNTGDGADFIFTGSFDITPDYPYLNSFGMKAVSFIGYPETGLFESYSLTGNPLKDYFNKISEYNFSFLRYQTDKTYNSGYVDVFLDGLIKSSGEYSITGEFFNKGVELSGDYFISGKNIFFRDNVSSSGLLIYDTFNSGDKQYFTSGDFYSGAMLLDFLPVQVSNTLFFVEGEKLISGLHYSGKTGLFAPIESVRNTTGEIRTLSFRPNQIYLENLVLNKFGFTIGLDFLSGTTGVDPIYEIISGYYDGDFLTDDIFSNPSGSFVLESGSFGTGFYISETGITDFNAYTGWQIYSGSEVYDIRYGLEPSPPLSGWENDSEFLAGWLESGYDGVNRGGPFLRNSSINWVNGVRINRNKFVEHGSIDLLFGDQILFSGYTGFFINNTDFWA